MKRFIALFLCAILLLCATACGDSGKTDTSKQTVATTTATEDEKDDEYPYWDNVSYLDASGDPAEIVILNLESYCGTNLTFVPEEETQEVLNVAMFRRNRAVEEKLGVTITEDRRSYTDMGGWGTCQYGLGQLVINACMAGDALWDIANLFPSWNAKLITTGSIKDLNSVSNLHLSESYWDQGVMEDLTLKGKCYTGYSDLTLMPLDLTWALFFNEDIMTSLKLDAPYEMVQNKQWTLDTLLSYVKSAESLNPTMNYNYETDNTTKCVISTHSDATSALVIAAGNMLMTKTESGSYEANISTDRLYDTIETVIEIFAASKGHSQLNVSAPNSSNSYGYCEMFKNKRSLFMTAEIKAADDLRDMDSDWGVLPLPLYNSDQENYISVTSNCAFLTLPTVQNDLDRAAMVLDALSYYSTEVMDIYYNVIVTHRNLQNQDSVNMLKIINENVTMEVGTFFEFTSAYLDALRTGIKEENFTPASVAEKQSETIENRVEKFFDSLEE